MVECMQSLSTEEEGDTSSDVGGEHQLHTISLAAVDTNAPLVRSMKLEVTVEGHTLKFLIDSGSSICFLDNKWAIILSGSAPLDSPMQVRVAGGELLQCTEFFPQLQWETQGHTFSDEFMLLPLETYDGIIGHDWLAKHSPMLTHWSQHWLALHKDGEYIVLQGTDSTEEVPGLFELHVVAPDASSKHVPEVHPDFQQLFDQFATVFEAPTTLPPRRQHDHHIPLIPGAPPVSMRPYRVSPELKSEIERQVQELLQEGVITHNSSAFASPVLLVRKSDGTWRLVIDYRQLNAISAKGKYPLLIIDELLDELAGARWFSKLDLRTGYHQIRLAPG